MNELIENSILEDQLTMRSPDLGQDVPDQDDRYPGSFFRVVGVPTPGQTTWSIN